MKKMHDLYMKTTNKGNGVFTEKKFSAGECVIEFRGKLYTREHYIRNHNPDNNHYLQIDDDTYMGPSEDLDDYINHSCNPNCGIRHYESGIFLFALRDIEKHEEITFDYSTTMDEDLWEMECRCGEKECRGTVRDFKYLPKAVQKRYIEMQVVSPFILSKMKERQGPIGPE